MADFNSGTVEQVTSARTRQQRKGLPITLIDGTVAGSLKEGQEVYLSGNNTVKARTLGTQYPLGTVVVPKNTRFASDVKITVAVALDRDIFAAAGATLVAGAMVKPDGTLDADDRPVYVAAVAGDYVSAIVLAGGASGAEIRIGILTSAHKM